MHTSSCLGALRKNVLKEILLRSPLKFKVIVLHGGGVRRARVWGVEMGCNQQRCVMPLGCCSSNHAITIRHVAVHNGVVIVLCVSSWYTLP